MTLMRLAPECVRLRRMARAHAAGEMTESEYRQARREVIDAFPAVPPADDDTRPRWHEDTTLRNDTLSRTQYSSAILAGTADPVSRRWMWLLVGALVLAALVLGAPDYALAAVAEVPPVRDRPPDPASSPRLPVRAVEVVWGEAGVATPGPVELGRLQTAADAALADLVQRNAPGPHGFTPSELEEIGRFLNVLGVHDAGDLDAADARDLSALIREQKLRRGISVAQLEEVAAAVQGELRAAGYFLGAAYVPAQQLDSGVARIDVLPGRLGDIVVEGGDPGPVTGTFAPLLGQPVTLTQISRRLQTVNALPGFTAQASFGPGSSVGESRLRLDLLEQRTWSGSVGLDNHGDDATGDLRVSATGAWLNPRRVGDRLSVGALVTVDPANQTYGYVDYDTPIPGGFRLSTRLGNNDFSVAEPERLDGDGLFLDLVARRDLVHRREQGATLVFSLARQGLNWDDGVEQSVSMAGAGLAGHRVWDGPRIAADAAVNLSAGHVGGDRFVGQEDDFWLLEMDAEAWMPTAFFGGEQKLRLRGAAQWSDSLLPATRRFALGGAHRARAFDRGVFMADRGVLVGVEIRVPATVGELLAFAETGYGDGRATGANTWAQVTDLGIGWEAELRPGLASRLSLAVPVAARGTGGIDDDGTRLYWSLRYAH